MGGWVGVWGGVVLCPGSVSPEDSLSTTDDNQPASVHTFLSLCRFSPDQKPNICSCSALINPVKGGGSGAFLL